MVLIMNTTNRYLQIASLALLLTAIGASGAELRAHSLPQPTLGVSAFVCHCTLITADEADGRDLWSFDSEPEIQGITPRGPADGILEVGDLIIAIDDHLITTEEGGLRWSMIVVGQRVKLRLSRGGEIRDVFITVGEVVPAEPEVVRAPEAPARLTAGNLMIAGWLGMGLSCNCTVQAGEPPSWSFHEPPAVEGVTPAGPAARAGLEPGDVLLSINGRDFTTDAGGRAFSTIIPGQRVQLRVERDGAVRDVVVEAESR
jgi:S1-C subfamily serine protease